MGPIIFFLPILLLVSDEMCLSERKIRLHPLFEPSPAKNSEIIMVIFFLATVCLEPIYLFSSRLSPKGMRAPSFSGFDDLEAHHITQRRTVEITEFLFPLKEEKKEGKNKMSL